MILDLIKCVDRYNLKIDGVLHIGANVGNEYSTYLKLGISPMIFIEPLDHIYEELVNNVKGDTNCITINKAIGNDTKQVVMHTETNGNYGSSSILKPKLHLTQYPHIDLSGKTTVDMVRIDDLNIPQVNFINIDIQGYELEAMKGSSKYLQKVDYIMTEVNKEELYESVTLVSELDEYLNEFGFKRVETNWAGKNWGDSLYIKQI